MQNRTTKTGKENSKKNSKENSKESFKVSSKTKAVLKGSSGLKFHSFVVPDALDIRDRMYQPSIGTVPLTSLDSTGIGGIELPILHQKKTNACTGFALATAVNYLLRKSGRESNFEASAFMLYSMARRYDEFPGSTKDTGSSIRGAIKGWYKHGVCQNKFWKNYDMPKAEDGDWWFDAANRPLGAYYRIDAKSVTDMQIALNETGVLYASSMVHDGWDIGKQTAIITIPEKKEIIGGHAFVIVGYNTEGFIVQNSWGKDWGLNGKAILGYQDWIKNAMDCWLLQIGVPTTLNAEIGSSPSLRLTKGEVTIANDKVNRNREIAPFIINVQNNGELSHSGEFRTNPDDVNFLINHHASIAKNLWQPKDDILDIAIYAHGGLVDERSAADTAEQWIKQLYDNKIFPVFIMWETGLIDTLKNIVEDYIRDDGRTSAFWASLRNYFDERLEKLLSPTGTKIWGEIKENAELFSARKNSGGYFLGQAISGTNSGINKNNVRLHLVGHSAGSILLTYLANEFAALGYNIETMSFMAPAATTNLFKSKVFPLLSSNKLKRYYQLHLTDFSEKKDNALLYGKSLLYLVSGSFEGGVKTPILGMEKYFQAMIQGLDVSSIRYANSNSKETNATRHADFDNDPVTIQSVIKFIKNK